MDRMGRVTATEEMLIDYVGKEALFDELSKMMSSDLKEYFYSSMLRDWGIKNEYDMYDDWNGYDMR